MKFWKYFFPTEQTSEKATEQLTIKDRLQALGNLPKFFKLVWQVKPSLAFTNCLLRLFQAVLPIAMLYVGKLIIEQVVMLTNAKSEIPSHAHLWQLIGIEAGLAVLLSIFAQAIALVDNLLGELVTKTSSANILAHAATLDLEQFENSAFYDKFYRAQQQTVGRTALLSGVFNQLQQLVTISFLAFGLLTFYPWLIVIISAAVVPAFILEYYFNGKNYALKRRQTQGRRHLDYLRHLGTSDQTVKEVKIFDLSSFIINQFLTISSKLYDDVRRLAMKRFVGGSILSVFGTVCFYSAYVFIIGAVVKGTLSIGDLTFIAGSLQQFRARLQDFLIQFNNVSMGAIYLKDYYEFCNVKPIIAAPGSPQPFPKPIAQGFTFEDVGFRYVNSKKWAIRHVNFTLSPGETLALVGENGSGKTTLVKLLARLYDPSEGRILLDGYDLRNYDLAELRKQIGIVFQDFIRYQMTSSLNIAVGNIKEKDNYDLVLCSARKSFANEVIEKLPNQYEQMLGRQFDEGVELSGGEWQKVALARAYMRDSQLLILDEPTSALDARAEYEVFRNFSDLTKRKTAVLISHRFSTVRMADRILVLVKGELREAGSHEQLLKKEGYYAEMFNLQAIGYK